MLNKQVNLHVLVFSTILFFSAVIYILAVQTAGLYRFIVGTPRQFLELSFGGAESLLFLIFGILISTALMAFFFNRIKVNNSLNYVWGSSMLFCVLLFALFVFLKTIDLEKIGLFYPSVIFFIVFAINYKIMSLNNWSP